MAGRPKGSPKSGGRVAGTPNKKTAEARETIQRMLDAHAEDFSDWIRRTAATDPAKAASLYLDAMSFVAPRMKAVEHSGEVSKMLVMIDV